MSDPAARHLVVGRLRKPHGLKGEVSVFPITGEPEEIFAVGRSVWLLALDGGSVAGPLEITRARGYHREWLLSFAGHESRDAVDGWRDLLLAVPRADARPPEGDEVYVDELVGFAVRGAMGEPLGVVSNWYELPGGITLEVQGPKREFMLPYRKQFVREVDREGRALVVEAIDGLFE
ncbi:MAG: ribosome maturation factor RimM [Gemmatimonadales bacterium]